MRASVLRVVQGPNANATVTCVCGDLEGMDRGPASKTTWVVENIPKKMQQNLPSSVTINTQNLQ
jgi:hypothetical protein